MGADGVGGVWGAGRPANGGSHALLSRWNGRNRTEEELPAKLTSASVGSTILDLEGIPGSRTVLAAGGTGCDSVTDTRGLPVYLGISVTDRF